jgi:predicted lipoprotein with Yx(FWY)xxD motif
MRSLTAPIAALLLMTAVVGCSSTGASPAASAAAVSPSSAAASPSAAASSAAGSPSAAASGSGSGVTVEAKPVGAAGTILVAGSNGMTVYTFTKDVKDSGKSACSGDCLAKWPALTVAAGATPSAGTGVTGKLATITRDDGTLQVTYNGLPLYFFINDKAPGDANGIYPNWEAVKP